MNAMHEFSESYFATLPEDAWFYLWTLPDHQSRWFQQPFAAIAAAHDAMHTDDVYFGLGIARARGSDKKRIEAEKVDGILAMWADIDYDVAGHHKDKNVPPTRDDALNLIKHLPEPSFIIDSGGGIHVYWFLREAWMFDSDDDRAQAALCVLKWQESIRRVARDKGWKIDATADLARVLRFPGTLNHKIQTDIKNVVILEHNDARYSSQFIWNTVKDVHVKESSTKKAKQKQHNDDEGAQGENFTLRADAQPPYKLAAMLKNTRFKRTWERQRDDFPSNDYSASSYCASLAVFLVRAGWSDQEIIDALVLWRKTHNEDLQLNRPDKYQSQLDDARGFVEAGQRGPDLDGTEDDLDPETRRLRKLDIVSQRVGVRIVRVEKYLTDPPQYRLVTDRGAVHIGAVANLLNLRKFSDLVADAARVTVPLYDKFDWQAIRQLLLDCLEEIEVVEGTIAGRMQESLASYFAEHKPLDSWDDMIHTEHPVIINGVVYISLNDFAKFYSVCYLTEQETRPALALKLRHVGAMDEVINQRMRDGKRAAKRVWRIPDSAWKMEENEMESETRINEQAS